MFAARQATDAQGQWDPSGGSRGCGYWLPSQWEQTIPTEHWLDPGGPLGIKAYRPGYALGAVMGHRVDLLDVDPRNGGDVTRDGLVAAGMWPTVYAAADTPSGGTHEFVAPLGTGSRDALRDGLDVKSGTPEGKGRGFAFIAPTVKMSKVTGQLGAYRWTLEPDLDAIDPHDDTGAALAEMVRTAMGPKASQDPFVTVAGEGHWPHVGPVPDGRRYPALRAYAGSLRRRDVHLDEALVLLRGRWQDCAQPPQARFPMPWDDAEALLRDIFGRYPPDAVPAAVEDVEQEDPDAQFERRLAFNRAVSTEADKLRVRDAANRVVRLEREGDVTAPTVILLPDLLARPRRDARYRIEGLQPLGARVMCAAAWKAGKSTLNGNLIRSLVDGDMFLGRYPVLPPAGRVTLLDDELDEDTLRDWLDDQGIVNRDRVAVVSLRGIVGTFDILDPECRAQWAKRLRDAATGYLILDCLRPVLDALGLSEDKDAGRFLVAFDALLKEAEVPEGLVTHHMGHVGERSRGDSRLRDWPDVEWRMVREKGEDGQQDAPDARRYFSAYGRDVDQPEGLLHFDKAQRRLTLTGGSRKDTAADEVIPDLLTYLAGNPGASGRQVEVALVAEHGRDTVRTALRRVVTSGQVRTEPGPRRATLHFLQCASAPSVRERTESECASAPLGGALALTDEQTSAPPRTDCLDCGLDLTGPPSDRCGCRDEHGQVA